MISSTPLSQLTQECSAIWRGLTALIQDAGNRRSSGSINISICFLLNAAVRLQRLISRITYSACRKTKIIIASSSLPPTAIPHKNTVLSISVLLIRQSFKFGMIHSNFLQSLGSGNFSAVFIRGIFLVSLTYQLTVPHRPKKAEAASSTCPSLHQKKIIMKMMILFRVVYVLIRWGVALLLALKCLKERS